MAKFLVLHGPNLNLLGAREPEIYGYDSLQDIDARLAALAEAQGHQLECLQSNAEHVLVERIQAARGRAACAIINPGAFTHTSIALRDAFLAAELPFIEVHLSNIHARESFRRTSYLSDIAQGVITGLGARGYEFALQAVMAAAKRGAAA